MERDVKDMDNESLLDTLVSASIARSHTTDGAQWLTLNTEAELCYGELIRRLYTGERRS